MKIVLVHKFIERMGGAEVFVDYTEEALRHAGHDVVRFASRPAQPTNSEYEHLFPAPPRYTSTNTDQSVGLLQKVRDVPKSIYSPEAGRSFARLIDDFSPDVVHCFATNRHLTPAVARQASKAGLPVLQTCNDYQHICPNYKLFHHGKQCFDCRGGNYFHAVKNKCCHDSTALSLVAVAEAYVHRNGLNHYETNVSHYTFASKYMASMTEQFWDRDVEWTHLRNPFPLDGPPTAAARGEHYLYFGRLVEEKGVDILIREYAASARRYPLKIVGSGAEEQRLRTMAAELGVADDVDFLGELWNGDLAPIIDKAIATIVPSRWPENYPYVVLQSYAAGVPVIASAVGGLPELLKIGEDMAGLLFDPAEAGQLDGCLQLADAWSGQERLSLGATGRAHLEQAFSREAITTTLLRTYEQLCAA